jgi:hypothetical protein
MGEVVVVAMIGGVGLFIIGFLAGIQFGVYLTSNDK